MLASQYRFHGHNSLRRLFSRSITRRTRHMMMRYAPSQRRSASRVAVVVSKKICKSAVGRNRARRRIFEIVRHEYQRISSPHDIVITVSSPEVLAMTPADLYREIMSLLEPITSPRSQPTTD